MATKKSTKKEKEISVEERLRTLYKLQMYLSDIDRIKTILKDDNYTSIKIID